MADPDPVRTAFHSEILNKSERPWLIPAEPWSATDGNRQTGCTAATTGGAHALPVFYCSLSVPGLQLPFLPAISMVQPQALVQIQMLGMKLARELIQVLLSGRVVLMLK